MTLKTKVNSVVSHIEKGKRKTWRRRKNGSLAQESWISFLERERVFLLSSFLNDPTVGNHGQEGKLLYAERVSRGYQI